MLFTHLLVPTDFSDPARHALQYALKEATLHQARVTLLHVLPPRTTTEVYYLSHAPEPPPLGSLDAVGGLETQVPPDPAAVLRDFNEETLARLRELIPDSFHGTVEAEIATGHAADTIVRVAQERNADLIVMGTRGRTGLQHVVLGSVAERVVRLAPCPVLTVRRSLHTEWRGPVLLTAVVLTGLTQTPGFRAGL